MQRHYTYLALGDSYTIGEAIALPESFPYQTVQLLRQTGQHFSAPEIVARTGWTTEELQAAMANYLFAEKYDFVTLLIGVNNQYRSQNIVLYKQHLEALLKRCLELAGGKKEHVFVFSIPDYSVTPFAREKETGTISKEIEEYNKLCHALCIQYKIPYIEITEGTRKAKDNPELLAEDGLHPSVKEYKRWAKKLSEAISGQLKK